VCQRRIAGREALDLRAPETYCSAEGPGFACGDDVLERKDAMDLPQEQLERKDAHS
jgi:hypothetical protein